MTKPTTKSPTERRLRKDIRPLLQAYKAGTIKEDQAVRELLALIDDEVRRARMSIAPVIDRSSLPSCITNRDVKLHFASTKDWKEWAKI